MRVSPVETPTCVAFKEYEEVTETVPLDFSEHNFVWVAYKLSGATGALGAEVIELRNWLICFRCVSEEFRVVFSDMYDCMANFSYPWDAYRALMACHIIALDNHPGVRPLWIGERLRWAIAKLIMQAVGDQAKTACGSLQLCADIEDGIEGVTHAIAQRRRERSGERRRGRRVVRNSGGRECGGNKRESEDRGGRESCRNMRSAATTQRAELRGRRVGQGERQSQNCDGRDGGERRGDE